MASFWDTNVGRHREPFAQWESPAPIQHALNKLVTGEISVQPPRWFMHQYGPFEHVAELGCGDGIVVRFLLDIDPGLKVDSYDISPRLSPARQIVSRSTRERPSCRFLPIDLNKSDLPEAAYDAVLTTGTCTMSNA